MICTLRSGPRTAACTIISAQCFRSVRLCGSLPPVSSYLEAFKGQIRGLTIRPRCRLGAFSGLQNGEGVQDHATFMSGGEKKLWISVADPDSPALWATKDANKYACSSLD